MSCLRLIMNMFKVMKKRFTYFFVVSVSMGVGLSVQAASPNIDSLLQNGQTISIYTDDVQGQCVGALGFGPLNVGKNKSIELAKSLAVEELATFLKGQSISSQSRSSVSNHNGQLSEEFASSLSTRMEAMLRSVRVLKTGTYDEQRYVFASICEKSSKVSQKVAQSLSNNTLTAVGTAAVDGGRDKARKMALDDALRNAVSQYNGVSAVSHSTVTDGEELSSKMATRTKGVVSNYRIVKEKVENGIYRVEIVATVMDKPKADASDVKTIRENLGRPAIYIQTQDSFARKELELLLKKHSYDVTRRKDQARFIMTVKVDRLEQPTIADMMGCRTILDISLKDKMSSDQALIITNDPDRSIEASDNKHLRVSRSMNYAVHSISEEILKGLNAEFVDQFNNGVKVVVSFSRFSRLSEVEALGKLLNSFPLTKKVVSKPIQNNVAYFDVLYLGDPNDLQIQTLKNAHKYRLNGLRAKNQKGDGIDFTF